MFSYLRYFSVISLIVILAGAWILGLMLTRLISGDFIAQQQAQHLATIDSYASTVWRANSPPAAGQNDPIAAARLQQESQQFFAHQPVAKITIFSPDVRQLYFSSTRAYATTDGTQRVTLFDLAKIQRSQATSRLLTHVFLTGGTDATMPRTLLQSIVPIRSSPLTSAQQAKCALANAPSDAPCIPEALVEIFTDITPLMQRLTRMQYIVSGAVVVTFLLLLGILMVTAMRAETIISRQHEVNLALTAAASAAEAQSRDKSQFLTNISHELRTPLNAIIGFSDLIKNEAGHLLSENHQSYVADIHHSGKHLLSLINDILDYSKAEAGKLELDWVESDLGKIIRNSLRMVMPRAETAQVMLVEDILTESMVIVTDSKKLKQVLLNLLSNAVKFTPAGGEVRCSVWEEIATQQIVIQVKDTGIGIAAKDIAKVMMPFGQVDSSLARKYEGTGLGLPLASKFIEIMGGQFLIESALGQGTTITIHLPKTPKNWSSQKQESPHVQPDPGVEAT